MAKIIALVSGKGGVGRTCMTLNLGVSLALLEKKVLLVDADLGMPDLGLYAGVKDRPPTFYDVLTKDKRRDIAGAIQKISVDDKSFDILPCSFSLREFLDADLNILPEIINELSPNYDYILLDTASGLSKHSLVPPRFSDQVLFIVSPEPASGSDSSRLKLALQTLAPKLDMIAALNKFKKGKGRVSATDVQSRLGIETLVEIPEDDEMDESIRKRVPLVVHRPKSKAAKAIIELARMIDTWGKAHPEKVEREKEGRKGFRVKKVFRGG